MVLPFLLLLAGFAILIKGADFLVSGASSAAKKFGVSNLAIGLTVVAFGTSTPELIVSLMAALDGKADASFGNVIGSNNFNMLFILGIAGLICPLTVQRNTVKYEVPLSLFAAGLMFFLVNDVLIRGAAESMLTRLDSGIMLLCFFAFLLYIYRTMASSGTDSEEGNIKIYRFPIAAGMVVAGLAMLVGGGKLVVDNAISIAQEFGLSEKIIGLTILAAGTSLPELATSALAAYRRNADIAIGNVVGSNIFNIFFILPVTGLVNPIAYNPSLNFDVYVLGGATIILMIFMFTLKQRRLDRLEAALFLGAYAAYTLLLLGME